LNINNKLIL